MQNVHDKLSPVCEKLNRLNNVSPLNRRIYIHIYNTDIYYYIIQKHYVDSIKYKE